MKSMLRLVLLFGSFTLLVGGGCFFDLGPTPEEPYDPGLCQGDGRLEVQWVFDGEAYCPDDAMSMIVQVFDIDGNPLHENEQGDEYSCEPGSAVFPGLACGEYSVVVGAIDDFDEFSWESASVQIVVRGFGRTVAAVNLLPAP